MRSVSGYCLLCHQKTEQKLCCTYCEQDLQPVQNRCLSCGCLLPDASDSVCGQCQSKPPIWQVMLKLHFVMMTHSNILSIGLSLRAKNILRAYLLTRLFLQRIQLEFHSSLYYSSTAALATQMVARI